MIIQWYLTKRLLFASCIAMLATYIPVLLLQLISQLPGAALSSELMWPALLGLAPTIFYITLPVAVGIANTWAYSELSTENTLTILYTAGFSALSVRMPAFFISLLAIVLGYATSCVLAPQGATTLENVLHVIENDLSPSLIEPGRFYSLNRGQRVIQYQERLSKNQISGVFMREIDGDEEVVFFAHDAIFERRDEESWIILRDGYMQTRKSGDTSNDAVTFTQITRPTGLAGVKLPKRAWTGFFEMKTSAFLKEFPNVQSDPRKSAQWYAEALERFGIPILALAHTMLGLALVSIWVGTGRSGQLTTSLICGIILLVHFLIVLACEFATSQSPAFAIAVGATMLIEMATAIVLFLRRFGARSIQNAGGSTSMLLAGSAYKD